MTVPDPGWMLATRYHCPDCSTEWWTKMPCWLCGGTGTLGPDPVVPWTASGNYIAEREEVA